MILRKNESVIYKLIKIIGESSDIVNKKFYPIKTRQRFLRSTWWFLFIPIFRYDKRID